MGRATGGLRQRLTTAAGRAQATLDSARQRYSLVDLAWLTYERDRQAVGSVLAGAVAFRLFVYLLPLFLAVLTVAGVLFNVDEDSTSRFGSELGMGGYVVDSIHTASQQSGRGLWVLVPLSLWAIYFAGVRTAKVLHAVHALAWRRPLTRLGNRLAAAGVTFLISVAVLAIVVVLQAVREHSDRFGLLVTLGALVPFVGVWLVVSLLLPHDPRAGWFALLPGAALVGAFTWAGHLTSVYWLSHQVHSASQLYGSLGVAAAILAWLYLLGRLMVASAVLNATLRERTAAADQPR